MNKPRMVISMEGGLISFISCDVDIAITLVDWDCVEEPTDTFRGDVTPDAVGSHEVDCDIEGITGDLKQEFCQKCKYGGIEDKGWACIDDNDVRWCDQYEYREE
jgi:hypothetical protein